MSGVLSFLESKYSSKNGYFVAALLSTIAASGAVLTITSLVILLFIVYNFNIGDNRIPEIYVSQPTQTASLHLSPENSSLFAGEYFALTLLMDTGGNDVSSGQSVVNFDPDALDYVGAHYLFRSSQSKIATDADKGAILFDYSFKSDLQGKFKLANLIFRTKKAITTKVSFDCNNTLLLSGGENVVDCQNLSKISLLSVLPASSESLARACSSEIPLPPSNLRVEKPTETSPARLSWDLPHNATHVSVYYGTNSGYYEYGIPNIGLVDTYRIPRLDAGSTYYFVVAATNDCVSSTYSNEVAITVNESQTVVAATKEDVEPTMSVDGPAKFAAYGREVLVQLWQSSPFKQQEFIAILSVLIVLVSLIVFLLSLNAPARDCRYKEKKVW